MPGMAGIADMGRHFVSTTGACLRGLAERLQMNGGAVAVIKLGKSTCEMERADGDYRATQG
jgi:hypothetical protein